MQIFDEDIKTAALEALVRQEQGHNCAMIRCQLPTYEQAGARSSGTSRLGKAWAY